MLRGRTPFARKARQPATSMKPIGGREVVKVSSRPMRRAETPCGARLGLGKAKGKFFFHQFPVHNLFGTLADVQDGLMENLAPLSLAIG